MTRRAADAIAYSALETARRLYGDDPRKPEFRVAYLRGVHDAYVDSGRPEDGPLARELRHIVACEIQAQRKDK